MKRRCALVLGFFITVLATAAEPPSKDPPADVSADALYQAGKDLFDSLAPPEFKEQFEFPDRAQWDGFVNRLQLALDGENPAALAQLEPEARSVLATLQAVPGSDDYLDWLGERLDYIEAAKQMGERPPSKPPVTPTGQFIPNYDLWLGRVATRPSPATAVKYVARLKPTFAAGKVPAELVWLAEVESSFNPDARSPAGARGLYQLMPATARELGLSTALPDQRTDPEKSAQAAARLLRELHGKFGDWPLAIAAYNAGAGRVQRALVQKNARTFAQIASVLPVEARMYVPKVLATIKVRTGVLLASPAVP